MRKEKKRKREKEETRKEFLVIFLAQPLININMSPKCAVNVGHEENCEERIFQRWQNILIALCLGFALCASE